MTMTILGVGTCLHQVNIDLTEINLIKKKWMSFTFTMVRNEEAEELSQNEPTYVGRGLRDNKIMSKLKNAIRSFNEEDMDDDSDWEEIDLDDETDESQLEEDEATEGNAFTGALAKC
jgi:hypothetical protein